MDQEISKSNRPQIKPEKKLVSNGRLIWLGFGGGILAGVSNALIHYVAQTVFNVSLLVQQPGSNELAPLLIGNAIIVSIIPALAGSLVLVALKRFTKKPLRNFIIISIVILGLSLVAPLTLKVDMPTKLVLQLMHLTSGVAVIWILSSLGTKKISELTL